MLLRQKLEALELEVLLPVFFSLPLDRRVAGPVHHGGEAVLALVGLQRPVVERDGLHGVFPRDAVVGREAAGPADLQPEREVAVVRADALGVIGIARVEQPGLAEHRVAVDEHLVLHAKVVVLEPAGAGDVDEEIRVLDQVARGRFTRAVELAVGAIAIYPTIAETELGHHCAEVADVVGAIVADGLLHRVVRPRAGILEVPDIVAQRAKAEEVLDVIPRHAAEGILAEKSGDDDSHDLRLSKKRTGVTRKGRRRSGGA